MASSDAHADLARRAVSADGTVRYLVPGDGTLCLAAIGAATCGSAESAESSGLIVSSKQGYRSRPRQTSSAAAAPEPAPERRKAR
jgi:hypothetical protein